ncbi:MAG: DUF1566 domain-containing protein [Terriglobales bacterium]
MIAARVIIVLVLLATALSEIQYRQDSAKTGGARLPALKTVSEEAATWKDPANGLEWAQQDNGGDVDWYRAKGYCTNLRLHGYTDWRLATTDELSRMFDRSHESACGAYKCRIKGGIKLSSPNIWSNNPNPVSGTAGLFIFTSGSPISGLLSYSTSSRALCVRGYSTPAHAMNSATQRGPGEPESPESRRTSPAASRPVATGTANAAAIMVSTDLRCTWELDGVGQGELLPGSPASVLVGRGKHVVSAETIDKLDRWELQVDIADYAGKAVAIVLGDVRDTRLQAEQQKQQEAQWEQDRQIAEHQRQQDEHLSQEQESQRQRILSQPVWVDPTTGLIWAHKDNGFDVDWNEAITYCQNLRLAGYSGWRLPGINELEGLYDPGATPAEFVNLGNRLAYRVKGNILISGNPWTATQKSFGVAWIFNFVAGSRESDKFSDDGNRRALCVRRAKN